MDTTNKAYKKLTNANGLVRVLSIIAFILGLIAVLIEPLGKVLYNAIFTKKIDYLLVRDFKRYLIAFQNSYVLLALTLILIIAAFSSKKKKNIGQGFGSILVVVPVCVALYPFIEMIDMLKSTGFKNYMKGADNLKFYALSGLFVYLLVIVVAFLLMICGVILLARAARENPTEVTPVYGKKNNTFAPGGFDPNAQFQPNNQFAFNNQFQKNDAIPQDDRFSPKNNFAPPQNDQFAPKNDSFAPKNETFAPKNETFAPKNEAFAPKNETFAPKNEAFAPKTDFAPAQNESFSKPEEPQSFAPAAPAVEEPKERSLSDIAAETTVLLNAVDNAANSEPAAPAQPAPAEEPRSLDRSFGSSEATVVLKSEPEQKICPDCGTVLASTAKFCKNCGRAVGNL